MELHILDHTLTLRLTPDEADAFAADGAVEDAIAFGDGRRLRYAVRVGDDVERLAVHFADDALVVLVPPPLQRQWAAGDGHSLEDARPLGRGDILHVVVDRRPEAGR